MNELIQVDFNSEKPTVSGRELHAALKIKTAYKDWFPRMCEYGFVLGTDFNLLKNERVQDEGGRMVCREMIDHALSIDMAKELCMIQRTEIGRKFRQYFIEVEQAWNSPEAVMARALQYANEQLSLVTRRCEVLTETVAVQNQQIAEMKPKASYYDVVLQCKDLVKVSVIAKDYGWSAKRMNKYLKAAGVQFKQGDIWLLYQKYADCGYTSTKTYSAPDSDGEMHSHIHTYWTQKGRLFIYLLLKNDGILPLIETDN